jgi:hypothetical protein
VDVQDASAREAAEEVRALGVPEGSWFTTTSVLVHYILGAAGQNAANARTLARRCPRGGSESVRRDRPWAGREPSARITLDPCVR